MSTETVAAPEAANKILADDQIDPERGITGTVLLPCGYIDSSGTLHREVDLKEMTGRDEDLLSNPSSKNFVGSMNQVFANCITRIGSLTEPHEIMAAIPKLRIGDRAFLKIQLRRLSLGDIYQVAIPCPSCGQTPDGGYETNLGALKKNIPKDAAQTTLTVKTPSGRTVVIRELTGEDEFRFSRLLKDHKDDFMSAFMAMCVASVDGKDVDYMSYPLQSMVSRDRAAVRGAIDKLGGGVEQHLEFECPKCGHEFEADLPLEQTSFFFPSAAQSGSKTT